MRLLRTDINLKRAAGEILLIFVGVTIAIWFDNWNEDRLNRRREVEILKELDGDLEFLIDRLNLKIKDDSTALTSSLIIYQDLVSKNQNYSDSLDRHYATFYIFSVPGIKKTAFETMKSIGIDIVSNDSIRTSIIDLYDRHLNLIRWSMDWETNEFETKMTKLLDDNIRLIDFMTAARPIDYKGLKGDSKFINALNNYIFQKRFRIEIVKERIVGIKKLRNDIQSELKRLS